VTTPPSLLRLRPVAASHPEARRYLLARRNVLPRHDSVIAIAGLWAHQQVLRLGAALEAVLWCPGERDLDDSLATVVDQLVTAAGASYEISERTLARLHPGATAPGLLSVVRIPTWRPADVLTDAVGVVLVADGIEYAGNLGALVRTVDASGAAALVVTNPVARLTHPTIFSASRGTVLTTPTLEFTSVGEAQRALETAGFEIVVADPDAATDYRALRYRGRRTAFVVGAEGAGVCEEWRAAAERRVSISMRGRADSLNVATAAAILLFSRV
jgi:RNA methyltransferase, TrmH family